MPWPPGQRMGPLWPQQARKIYTGQPGFELDGEESDGSSSTSSGPSSSSSSSSSAKPQPASKGPDNAKAFVKFVGKRVRQTLDIPLSYGSVDLKGVCEAVDKDGMAKVLTMTEGVKFLPAKNTCCLISSALSGKVAAAVRIRN